MMNGKLRGLALCNAVFMGGLVAGMNCAHLLPNPNYNAAWWKVGLAVMLAIYFGYIWYKGNNERHADGREKRSVK